MRHMIIKIGQIGVVLLITAFSVIVSVLITTFILIIAGEPIKPLVIMISMIVPAIIAPIVSWYIIGLIIEIHYLERKMRLLASYDALTGVMSRVAFLKHCECLHQLMYRNQSSFSLLYIDIDDFKQINDTYEHAGGDSVLTAFGQILQTLKRKSDLVGRIGGEEFVLALPHTDSNGAFIFSNKLRRLTKNTSVNYLAHEIHYTISIGIASFDAQYPIDLQTLLRQSDTALYQAKHAGKNCVVIFVN